MDTIVQKQKVKNLDMYQHHYIMIPTLWVGDYIVMVISK